MKTDRCRAHLYLRTKTEKGTYTYKCIRCPHYINAKFVIGRLAKCNNCSNEFTMTSKSATMVKPHCGCRNMVKQQTSAVNVIKTRVEDEPKDDESQVRNGFLDDLVRKL